MDGIRPPPNPSSYTGVLTCDMTLFRDNTFKEEIKVNRSFKRETLVQKA
jgi:hypothetical protein